MSHPLYRPWPLLTSIAWGVGAVGVLGLLLACSLLMSVDSQQRLSGMLLGVFSGWVCAAAILLFAWGRPLKRTLITVLTGSLALVGVVWALLQIADLTHTSRLAARAASNEVIAKDRYDNARAYNYYAARYDEITNRILKINCHPLANDCNQIFVIPFRAEGFILLLDQAQRAYVFDGTKSLAVGISSPERAVSGITPGCFQFRGTQHCYQHISNGEIEYLRAVGSEKPYVNAELVEKIAPQE
jgi:hypothetical protein